MQKVKTKIKTNAKSLKTKIVTLKIWCLHFDLILILYNATLKQYTID